jgi:hypothetical protein
MKRLESQSNKLTDIETWKDIPGFENKYQASSFGNIRSINRRVNSFHKNGIVLKGKKLKLCKLPNGYLNISLGKNNTTLVHRVIAKTFIKNPENKPCINHKDGNKSNNNIVNLEWCTYSENEFHSYRVLGKKSTPPNIGKFGILSKDSKPVAMYSLSGNLLSVYGGASEAARELNKNQSRISCNARGETKKCYGSKFIYITKEEFAKYKLVKK